MNFLDTYGIAVPNVVTEEQQHQPEQSLDEEVSEVIGQLGRFWGGFKKQSQAVLQTARKDITDVVSQAQKELTKLTSEHETTESTRPGGGLEISDTGTLQPSTSLPTSSSSLFSRLQSALPPNLLEVARNQLPESIKHASENLDLPQLRNSLLNEFQRVQGVTRAHAEEYALKSEALIREAVKEAGEVLRDAVKILPPDHAREGTPSSVVWDGGNIWSLQPEPSGSDAGRLQFPEQAAQRGSDAQNAVTGRVEYLLLRLKQDPEIVRRNPATDSLDGSYAAWVASEHNTTDDDDEGDGWSGRISALLNEVGSGDALKSTYDTLVPSEMTESEFWKRFFFRVHQIEVEERKRRALIEGTLEEEYFNWEDEDEETSTSGEECQVAENSSAATLHPHTSIPTAQESGEEGYDVVTPGTMSPREPKVDAASDTARQDSSDDSDWE